MSLPGDAVRGATGLVRFTVTASVETARFGAGTTVRITKLAASGAAPTAVVTEATRIVRDALVPRGPATEDGEPVSPLIAGHAPPHPAHEPITAAEMMAALLDASADVDLADPGHPAYYRLLNELAPDEARILRLFAQSGPQPALDVRSKRLFGVGSKLLAPGITMIAEYAGITDKARLSAYLNNLHRLGLIWFSREMLDDDELYHLLEAQPEVLEAFKGQKIATVMRSIELTAFGRNLCELCGLLPAVPLLDAPAP